jgi:hypothetical protein
MGGYGGAMRARGFHQLAILQLRDCALHRAFGKTGFVSEHTQAGLDRTPALPGGTAGKIKVNEEGGRLLIVSDNVTHEDIENVIVDRDGLVKTRHGEEGLKGLRGYHITKLKYFRYTDKRTTLFAPARSLGLDADELRVLGSGHD